MLRGLDLCGCVALLRNVGGLSVCGLRDRMERRFVQVDNCRRMESLSFEFAVCMVEGC